MFLLSCPFSYKFFLPKYYLSVLYIMRHLFSLLIVVFETQYRKDITQLLEVQKTLTAISLSTWSTSTLSNREALVLFLLTKVTVYLTVKYDSLFTLIWLCRLLFLFSYNNIIFFHFNLNLALKYKTAAFLRKLCSNQKYRACPAQFNV
jgi:hypothetical protein